MIKIVWIVLFVFLLSACSTTPKEVTCTIASPQNGDAMQENETMTGTVNGLQEGWYVFAYTRAKLPSEPYWRSDKSAVVVGSNWTIDVVYGDTATPPDTEFETVIIVTSDQKPAPQIEQIYDLGASITCGQISVHR